ncbi:MAG TPA: 5-dehydro-2-deoxygluconokinase [Anaeromyxobacteraceae bacterium]|nr:5-dehydro-2-deoxygluconokinase [Anaeromyxobacteraceae bacterium]
MDSSPHSTPPPPEGKRLDVICLGRLAVDLYGEQLGARLEDAATFAKYLGGSSANVAFGCARLGLRAAMLSRVGDDHMGRFLLEALRREGCDVSHVSSDPGRLTGLVLLGIKDRESFPLIFYRQDCADMAIPEASADEGFIASSRALAITGTHLSTEHTHRVATLALSHARRNGVRTVLDIDYRPVLWGLTGPSAGEKRFVPSDRVTAHLQSVLPLFDLVVGTEEEFRIAGGGEELLSSLRSVRAATPAVLVLKLGAAGCAVIEGQVPGRLEEALLVPGFPVEVVNVLGAGDAFLAGFLKGWLGGAAWAECGRLGNACGALVVTRHACSAAMPTPAELEHFLSRPGPRPDQDPGLQRLHRVTAPRPRWDDLHVLAFDHRSQFFDLAREAGAAESRLPALKRLLVRAVAETESRLGLQGHVGALVDDTYGEDALLEATGRGWWLGRPVEVPGSRPLEFEGGRSIGTRLATWPREQVVKCLVRYHPDEPVEDRLEQETQLLALQSAVQATGHELLLEVVPPPDPAAEEPVVVRTLKRLYNVGLRPEWWKLQPMPAETWGLVDALLAERDPYCRGVVILGLDASVEELAAGFRQAASARSCRGFVVGRTIFREPSADWLAGRIGDQRLVAAIGENFEALIRVWREARGPRKEAA